MPPPSAPPSKAVSFNNKKNKKNKKEKEYEKGGRGVDIRLQHHPQQQFPIKPLSVKLISASLISVCRGDVGWTIVVMTGERRRRGVCNSGVDQNKTNKKKE